MLKTSKFFHTIQQKWYGFWRDDWQSRRIKALIPSLVSWPSSSKCIMDYRIKWHMPPNNKRLPFLDKPKACAINRFVTYDRNMEAVTPEGGTHSSKMSYVLLKILKHQRVAHHVYGTYMYSWHIRSRFAYWLRVFWSFYKRLQQKIPVCFNVMLQYEQML